ncbi:GYF domain-containing protein [Flavobacterium sp. XS2P39]|uniref:GYF domain-containing protein n=1 Tax=Flavobacterium sp. XS2P39 TaxID=3401725 RepID=UPI003AB0812D
MKTYYIHNGTENSGPFVLEELKAKKITKTTLVWFEGMDEWKYAGDIEELKSILLVIPPPLKNIPPLPKEEKKEAPTTILGLDKNIFFLACGILALVIGTLIFDTYQQNRSSELEQKNNQTEFRNEQLELQQKEIDEQKIQLAIQEKIESERLSNEKKDSINSRLLEIKKLLVYNKTNLEESKLKLADAKEFQLLRSPDDRDEDISLIENDISHWQSENKKLENEMYRLYLKLQTVH